MKAKTTRDHIICAADTLFYERGFEATSFADIAAAVEISRGNFYHHFKAKDDILDAVIARRLQQTEALLEEWQGANADPVARITSFIHILIRNREKIMRYGCPVGTLSTELAKANHPSGDEANKLFGLFRAWLSQQFIVLGNTEAEADAHALHVLARSQGVATLAAALHDEAFIRSEVALLLAWLKAKARPMSALNS